MRRLTCMRAVALAALATGACTGAIDQGRKGAPGEEPGTGATGGPTNGGSGGSGGSVGPAGAERPGRTPMRRLTHTEYNNTIRDLVGLREDFAARFSGDEDAGGFAANTGSPVSEDQADQYHAAADAIATKAVAAGLTKLAPCAPPAGAAEACVDQ